MFKRYNRGDHISFELWLRFVNIISLIVTEDGKYEALDNPISKSCYIHFPRNLLSNLLAE
jgi:hypothetical protein